MSGENKIYIFAPSDVVELPSGVPAPRFTMDLVEDFTPVFSSDVTKYKISDKTNISNHRFKNNMTISLSGYVGTHPLQHYRNNIVGYDNLNDRLQNAYELIKRYNAEGTELTLVNKFDFYPRCLIKSFTPIQIGDDTILINLEFEQVQRATYQRVILVQNMDTSKKKDASPNVHKNDKKVDLKKDGTDKTTHLEAYKQHKGGRESSGTHKGADS